MTIVPCHSALAALHFQNEICLNGGRMEPVDPAALDRFAAAAARTAARAQAARAAGVAVIHVAFGRPEGAAFADRHGRRFRWISELGGCAEAGQGHAFIPALLPPPGAIVLGGLGTIAFRGPTLGPELTRPGAATPTLIGIPTHRAVGSPAREAAQRGHEVISISDGAVSANRSAHEAALKRLRYIARVEPAQALIAARG